MNYDLVLDYVPVAYRETVQKYVKFFFTGATGVLLNLTLTWSMTTFVFGQENYFYGYLTGLSVNLIYNFILHTYMTFKTESEHVKRFTLFVAYSLVMSGFQAYLVSILVPLIGVQYYLLTIAAIILTLSTVTFIIFNWWLFDE